MYEDLRQHQVRGLRAHCLFSGDSLSVVQVGFETHLAGERSLWADGFRSAPGEIDLPLRESFDSLMDWKSRVSLWPYVFIAISVLGFLYLAFRHS